MPRFNREPEWGKGRGRENERRGKGKGRRHDGMGGRKVWEFGWGESCATAPRGDRRHCPRATPEDAVLFVTIHKICE